MARGLLRRMRPFVVSLLMFACVAVGLQIWCAFRAWWLLANGLPETCERLQHWLLIYGMAMAVLPFAFTVVGPVLVWWIANGIVLRSTTPPQCKDAAPSLWHFVDEANFLGLGTIVSLLTCFGIFIFLSRQFRSLARLWGGPGPAIASMVRDMLDRPPAVVTIGSECAICLEEGEPLAIWRELPCGHHFHELCLVEWLRRAHLCPLCRDDLNTSYLGVRSTAPGSQTDIGGISNSHVPRTEQRRGEVSHLV